MFACLLTISLLQSPETSAAFKSMASRLDVLKYISVEYEFSDLQTPGPLADHFLVQFNNGALNLPSGKNTTRLIANFKPRKGTRQFIKLGQFTRFDTDCQTDDVVTVAFVDNRMEKLTKGSGSDSGSYSGYIRNIENQKLPDNGIDLALGLRLSLDNRWLTPEILQMGELEPASADGLQRFRLKGNPPNADCSHVWTLDPNTSFSILSYDVLKRDDDPEFGSIEYTCSEIRNSDFIRVDGLDLPQRIELRRFIRTIGREIINNYSLSIDVKKYRVDELSRQSDGLHIVWPTRTEVMDERNNTFAEIIGPPRLLSDAD
ncbi:MAG: hypothetical protein FJ267_06975, partial [Planctomycetes bacterium]|nr:hypothetical protein [Planctomycetota bacterium]